jgi:hypothetical protein
MLEGAKQTAQPLSTTSFGATAPSLNRCDLKYIGSGTRVIAYLLPFTNDPQSIVRIPFNPELDAEEIRNLPKLKRWFRDYLPNPQITSFLVDGVERTLVTADLIKHAAPLGDLHEPLLKFTKNAYEKGNSAIIENLRTNFENFLSQAQCCYQETYSLPDLAGRGNLVCTKEGELFLLDMNNSFVTDIFSLMQDTQQHERFSHITQQVLVAEPNGAHSFFIFNHNTSLHIAQDKIIVPVDENYWPAFDASLKTLLTMQAFYNLITDTARSEAPTSDEMKRQKKLLVQEAPFFRPLLSQRRSAIVSSLIEQFIKRRQLR